MKQRRCWTFPIMCMLFAFQLFMTSEAIFDSKKISADALDSIIQSYALKALIRRRTGIIYNVSLPASLSNVKAEVVRLTSKTLWLNGINVSSFQVPPKTISIPPARRLILVYQNLGNWSNSYYNVQNYSLATPVVGLLAYDATGTSNKLKLNVRDGSIIVSFPGLNLNSTGATCITFGSMGSQRLDNLSGNGQCSSENGGHFSIAVPSKDVSGPSPRETETKDRKWVIYVLGFGTAAGLVILFFIGVGIAKFVKKKKMEEMGRRADEGEVLENVWVNGSKMPSASMIRTQPVLENGSAP